MKKKIFTIIVSLSMFITFFTVLTTGTNLMSAKTVEESNFNICSDDFYFIQITDPHVMHKLFDKGENQYKFKTVIEHVNSFAKKPAFIVITGDLVEWGSGVFGTLNFKAFLECLYEKDGQLYADEDYSIPVYTIPGNHDYRWFNTLVNYHRLVDQNHVLDDDKYVITHENLTLFFMDAGHDYILKPRDWIHVMGSGLTYWFDILWLEDELSSCNSPHKIVLMHYPAINWGKYDTFVRNKDIFIQLCEGYNVDIVLTGHTHAHRVFDKEKNFYPNSALPLNCSLYSTLYVQTAATKGGIFESSLISENEDEGYYYRNVTISGNDIWLNPCEQAIPN